MIRIEFSIDVDRPPSEVFAHMTDTGRAPEWQSSLVEAEWQGERAPGSRIREVRRFLGRRLEIEQEVTAYEPDRRFGVRSVSGPFPLSTAIALEPRDGGTAITFNGEAEPGGFFKLAEPFVARAAERQIRGDFETLKDVLEGSPSA